MRHLHRVIALALIALVVVACSTPTATAPASATAESIPPISPAPTPDESGAPTDSPEPVPSDELGPFTCDLPIHVDATIARALVNDVRTGTHPGDGYDRVVLEFIDGLPEASLERDEPPFAMEGSGFPVEVQGESFLRLTMRGGTKQQEDGNSSYDGPTEFETDYPALVHLIEGGDFEAQSTWYFGLREESCVRVFTLTDDGTARLVIDIEH